MTRLKKLADRRTARRLGIRAWSVFRAILVIGISYYILYPLFVKFSLMFMSSEDLFDVTVRLIPRHFTTENLKLVFNMLEYPVAFLQTLGLSVLITLLQMLSCCLVGYGFARFEFPLKKLWFACVLLTLLVPPSVIIIPMYLRFSFFDVVGLLKLITGDSLQLINTIWPSVFMALTALGLRNGLFIYIIRQFFRNVPKELEEAATIDGAGTMRTFVSVMLPNARPILTTVAVFSLVWQWTDNLYSSWFYPQISLLATKLNHLIDNLIVYMRVEMGVATDAMDASYRALYSGIGCLLVILPLLIFYIFAQRLFVESVERSGIVG